jgi:LysM repeat protein
LKIHLLKAGEDLDQISERFGISRGELLDANPNITQPEVVPVGIKVRIPTQRLTRGHQVAINIEEDKSEITDELKAKSEGEANANANAPVQYGLGGNGFLPQDEHDPFDQAMFYNTRTPYNSSEWGGGYIDHFQETLGSEHKPEPESSQAPFPPAPSINSYEIVEGDTLWSVCKKFGLNVFELQLFNPHILDLEKLTPGMKIHLPQPLATPIPLKPFPAQPVSTQRPYPFPVPSRYHAGTAGSRYYPNGFGHMTPFGFMTPSPMLSSFMGYPGAYMGGAGADPSTGDNASRDQVDLRESPDTQPTVTEDTSLFPPVMEDDQTAQNVASETTNESWGETKPKTSSMQIKRRLSSIERKILALEKQQLLEQKRSEQAKANRPKTKGLQPGVWNRPSH